MPTYREALATCLVGEDMDALEAFAELARDGNHAAQIMLSSIVTGAAMHKHVTQDMPREDRIALLRIPQGLSGESWFMEAQKTESFAAVRLQVTRIGEKPAAIIALLGAGETKTALLAIGSLQRSNAVQSLQREPSGREDLLPNAAAYALAFRTAG